MKLFSQSLMLICLILPTAFAAAAQQDIVKYTDPNVQVNEVSSGEMVIVSSLNVLPNNDLLVIVFASQSRAAVLGAKAGEKGAIIGRISKDNGRTWGPAFPILQCPPDSSGTPTDCTTVVSGKKIIVIAGMNGPVLPAFGYGGVKLLQVSSTDNGSTWSAPTEIKLPRARAVVSGRQGVTLSDGTILVPYWWDFMFQTGAMGMTPTSDIPCVSGTMISVDGGATWNVSTDVYGEWSAQPKILHAADEPAIVAISDKEIFMVLRSDRQDGFVEETWSHDGGRSWELPKPGKLHAFNAPTGLWRMKNGWIVRLWDSAKNAQRFPLAVSISKDNCRTWSSPRTLVNFPSECKFPVQASYPTVVEAADGTLVATWCHVTPDGKWILASGRFTVEWALGEEQPAK
jgi:hypothetical protein